MKKLSLGDILSAINGRLITGNEKQVVEHATKELSYVRENSLYFHLNKRKIKDDSNFPAQSAIIVTEKPAQIILHNKNITIVKVEDINLAYWEFVNYYRNLFKLPVIGVTGTCGKTTTTEMIKQILGTKYSIRGTFDGANALIYNFAYLLGIDDSTEAAVFEMGVTSPGCVEDSCLHFKPQIGILLNIGVYHLEGCKTLETYIEAKAELLAGLNYQGTLIINDDDENIKRIDFRKFKGDIITIGQGASSHFRADQIGYGEEGITFDLHYKGESYSVYVPGYGKHNVYNALAAIAATQAIGVSIEEALDALAGFEPMRKHLQPRKGINGSTIIDDSWNCTPPSIKSALEVLQEAAKGRQKVAVIGYMPLLGLAGEEEYLKVGEKVVSSGVDALIIIGDKAKAIGVKALELGMEENRIYYCNTGDEVYDVLQKTVDQESLVLFKFPYKLKLKKISSFRKLMSRVFN